MLNAFLGNAIWFVIFSPLYFVIATAALRYNVSKRKPSVEKINIFLDKLNFPLNKFFVHSRYNLITYSLRRTEPDDLLKSNTTGELISLIIVSALSLLMITIFTLVILSSSHIALGILWTAIQLACFIKAFSFGRQLSG